MVVLSVSITLLQEPIDFKKSMHHSYQKSKSSFAERKKGKRGGDLRLFFLSSSPVSNGEIVSALSGETNKSLFCLTFSKQTVQCAFGKTSKWPSPYSSRKGCDQELWTSTSFKSKWSLVDYTLSLLLTHPSRNELFVWLYLLWRGRPSTWPCRACSPRCTCRSARAPPGCSRQPGTEAAPDSHWATPETMDTKDSLGNCKTVKLFP